MVILLEGGRPWTTFTSKYKKHLQSVKVASKIRQYTVFTNAVNVLQREGFATNAKLMDIWTGMLSPEHALHAIWTLHPLLSAGWSSDCEAKQKALMETLFERFLKNKASLSPFVWSTAQLEIRAFSWFLVLAHPGSVFKQYFHPPGVAMGSCCHCVSAYEESCHAQGIAHRIARPLARDWSFMSGPWPLGACIYNANNT